MSAPLTIHGRRYDTGEPVRITVAGERIAEIEPATPTGNVSDWPYVAPGLFDLQINGYGGIWFSSDDLTPERAIAAIEPYFAFGVTRLCPTLITNSHSALACGFAALQKACEQEPWVDRMVPGFHLEGPYLSGEDGPRGAHPKQHIRPANWDEFCQWQEISGNRIRLVTIAPEVAGAIEFIKRAVASGVTISLGHTAATPEQIAAGVEAGARLSTHLGNGAHGMLRRHPNYIWEQLADDRLHASIIADGQHLPASVVKTIIRTKSTRQTVLTCDASGWAGCKPGRYENALGAVDLLPDGRIVVAGQDQILGGSSAGTDICVSNAMAFASVTLCEAIDMACRVPSRLLGFEEVSLRRGSRADVCVFRLTDSRLEVISTIAAGEVKFGEIPIL